MVIEDTDVYSSAADWTKFRSKFWPLRHIPPGNLRAGASDRTGQQCLRQCAGVVLPGNEGEAELDAEWASAAAPNATIELARLLPIPQHRMFGGLLALQNLLDAVEPAAAS